MRKILIIDDEENFTYFIKLNLELTGNFEIDICNDSRYGVRMAKESRPHLILLDIAMPKIAGSEVAAALREDKDTRDIPIIFLTAMIRESEIKNYGNLIGGNYFLAKPVRIDDLVKMLNQILGLKPAVLHNDSKS